MRGLLLLLLCYLVSSCSKPQFLASSNHGNDWKDFHQPNDVTQDVSLAFSPEFDYSSGSREESEVGRKLYQVSVGASMVLDQRFVFGLGGAFGSGQTQPMPDLPDMTADRLKTQYWLLNGQIGLIKWNKSEKTSFSLLGNINFGKDSGEYYDYRVSLNEDDFGPVTDISSTLSFQIGPKISTKFDDDFTWSLYSALLINDKSTSDVYNRGNSNFILSSNLYYRDFYLGFRGSGGVYASSGISAGYIIQ